MRFKKPSICLQTKDQSRYSLIPTITKVRSLSQIDQAVDLLLDMDGSYLDIGHDGISPVILWVYANGKLYWDEFGAYESHKDAFPDIDNINCSAWGRVFRGLGSVIFPFSTESYLTSAKKREIAKVVDALLDTFPNIKFTVYDYDYGRLVWKLSDFYNKVFGD